GAAATEVGTHCVANVRVAGKLVGPQQRDSRHDLAALAVAALHDVVAHPGVLYRAADLVLGHGFDGRELPAGDRRRWCDASPALLPINVHRASAAHSNTAAELRARHAQRIAEHPEHRRVTGHVYVLRLPVQLERDHGWLPMCEARNGSVASQGAPLRIQRLTCPSNADLSR